MIPERRLTMVRIQTLSMMIAAFSLVACAPKGGEGDPKEEEMKNETPPPPSAGEKYVNAQEAALQSGGMAEADAKTVGDAGRAALVTSALALQDDLEVAA